MTCTLERVVQLGQTDEKGQTDDFIRRSFYDVWVTHSLEFRN